jgi:hypothetical protein
LTSCPKQTSIKHYNRHRQVKPTAQRTQGQALRVPTKIFSILLFIFKGKNIFAGSLARPPVAFFVAYAGYNAAALF